MRKDGGEEHERQPPVTVGSSPPGCQPCEGRDNACHVTIKSIVPSSVLDTVANGLENGGSRKRWTVDARMDEAIHRHWGRDPGSGNLVSWSQTCQ